jgi:predicted amidohydrolase
LIWAQSTSASKTQQHLRAIAVGNKVNLKYSETYETWTNQWLGRTDLLEARGEINSTTNPAVIVVGELTGLTSAFIGSRGQTAYAPQVEYYQNLYGSSMINAIEMALTDTMWRAFFGAFSTLASHYQAYVIAGTLSPRIRISHDKKEIAFFKDPDLSLDEVHEVYIADSPEVYNSAFIFSPFNGGEILGVIDKFHLTDEDKTLLQVTSGTLESSLTYSLGPPMGETTGEGQQGVNVCVAICYDAFFDDVLTFHDQQNCSVLIQPSYNTQPWASYVNSTSTPVYWQPDDWTRSTFASVSDRYPSIQYNVNAMQVGNLLDLPADGQSTITKKSMTFPNDTSTCFVGLDSSLNLTGK